VIWEETEEMEVSQKFTKYSKWFHLPHNVFQWKNNKLKLKVHAEKAEEILETGQRQETKNAPQGVQPDFAPISKPDNLEEDFYTSLSRNTKDSNHQINISRSESLGSALSIKERIHHPEPVRRTCSFNDELRSAPRATNFRIESEELFSLARGLPGVLEEPSLNDVSQSKGKYSSFQKISEQPSHLEAAHRFSRRLYMPEVTQFLYAVLCYRKFSNSRFEVKEQDQHHEFLHLAYQFIRVGSSDQVNISEKNRNEILKFTEESVFCSLLTTTEQRASVFDCAYQEMETLFLTLFNDERIKWFR